MHWRRKWQSTPVFLPGEFHGQKSLERLPSMGSHRVRHDWSDAAAAAYLENSFSPAIFKIFPLFFHSLTKICLRVDLFPVIFLEVNSESGECFSSKFYKLSVIMSTSNFMLSTFISLLSESLFPSIFDGVLSGCCRSFSLNIFSLCFYVDLLNSSFSLWILSATISSVLLNLSIFQFNNYSFQV